MILNLYKIKHPATYYTNPVNRELYTLPDRIRYIAEIRDTEPGWREKLKELINKHLVAKSDYNEVSDRSSNYLLSMVTESNSAQVWIRETGLVSSHGSIEILDSLKERGYLELINRGPLYEFIDEE